MRGGDGKLGAHLLWTAAVFKYKAVPADAVAIAAALAGAGPTDVVVVAGKGHETTQTVGEQVVDFDDRVVVREELARLGHRPSLAEAERA